MKPETETKIREAHSLIKAGESAGKTLKKLGLANSIYYPGIKALKLSPLKRKYNRIKITTLSQPISLESTTPRRLALLLGEPHEISQFLKSFL